jgi:hypothetical protein
MTDEESDDELAAEGAMVVACPYCGESVEISLDPAGGAVQEYVEDCQVCCQPWQVRVRWRRDGHADVRLDTTDG